MEYSKYIKANPWLKITQWDIVISMGTNHSTRRYELDTSFDTTSRTNDDVNAASTLCPLFSQYGVHMNIATNLHAS